MVPITMKRKAERRLRELLAESNFAQPDEVDYGPNSVTLYWHSVQKSINVDVTERGEIGATRVGPPSPKWDQPASSVDGRVARLATLGEKRAAERMAREMLDNHDVPQPDSVEYGATCIRLFWHEQKVVMIIDLDDRQSPVENRDGMPDEELAGPTAA